MIHAIASHCTSISIRILKKRNSVQFSWRSSYKKCISIRGIGQSSPHVVQSLLLGTVEPCRLPLLPRHLVYDKKEYLLRHHSIATNWTMASSYFFQYRRKIILDKKASNCSRGRSTLNSEQYANCEINWCCSWVLASKKYSCLECMKRRTSVTARDQNKKKVWDSSIFTADQCKAL